MLVAHFSKAPEMKAEREPAEAATPPRQRRLEAATSLVYDSNIMKQYIYVLKHPTMETRAKMAESARKAWEQRKKMKLGILS